MKRKVKIPTEILANIDFNNTLAGGSVESNMQINEQNDFIEIDITIPTVSPDLFKVEIIDNNLMVYTMQAVLTNTIKNGFMPRTIGNITLPHNIDREAISATYENKIWKITLPKNNEKNGFRKQVDIKY
jgi:HSP20 family molecular chaperone IbpA